MFGNKTDVGDIIKTIDGIHPANSGATTINGPWQDRRGFQSCTVRGSNGAASGDPSSYTVDCKLQHASDSSGTGAADISGAAATQITADNSGQEFDVDLSSVSDGWIRAVVTVAFTGGSSPAVPVAATIVLGGASVLPA